MKSDRPIHYRADEKKFENARSLRKALTPAEKIIWRALRGRKLNNAKFRRQHPIDTFIADFYCHEARLVVELDGSIHELISNKEYDIGRDYELRKLGLRILRFKNEEVIENLQMVIETIRKHLSS